MVKDGTTHDGVVGQALRSSAGGIEDPPMYRKGAGKNPAPKTSTTRRFLMGRGSEGTCR